MLSVERVFVNWLEDCSSKGQMFDSCSFMIYVFLFACTVQAMQNTVALWSSAWSVILPVPTIRTNRPHNCLVLHKCCDMWLGKCNGIQKLNLWTFLNIELIRVSIVNIDTCFVFDNCIDCLESGGWFNDSTPTVTHTLPTYNVIISICVMLVPGVWLVWLYHLSDKQTNP